MTKRRPSATQRDSSTPPATSSGTPTEGPLEQRLLAFAEQLGRIAGTVHAKAEGWMDGDALKNELARVRDGAADLLRQLTPEARPGARSKRTVGPAAKKTRGRSGGVVDAPGKKHRPPVPTDPGLMRADSQAAKMRAAKTMVKSQRRRGRG